ncbi:hypothetical protein [Bacillus manliponensis]|uniref:hypothetical protein n=1 Tax=Bacillus manliponensis TaxID=574376 RepID=UPI0035138829
MSFTILFLLFIIFIVLLTLFFIFATVKQNKYIKRPRKQSLVIISVYIVHLVLTLTGFYNALPPSISEFLFLPTWFFMCILGFIVSIKEWKNNRILSLCAGSISFISFLFGLLLMGISNM